MFKLYSLSITMLFAFSINAFAYPENNASKFSRRVAPAIGDSNYDFAGTVVIGSQIVGGCSASLVRFETSKDSDNAIVLSNGHCLLDHGFIDPNQFLSSQPNSQSFTVLNSAGEDLGEVTSTELIYATMTKTDISLFKLQETYAEIKDQFGVEPFLLSNKHPQDKSSIQIISSFWKKGYSCNINGFVYQLHEAGWINVDSIRYSTNPSCDTIPGTSGSPILLAGTHTIIGVNNTGNDSGEKCTEDNPCEVDEAGNITVSKGINYGQETYWIYSCLNSNNDVDLSIKGCQLFGGQN